MSYGVLPFYANSAATCPMCTTTGSFVANAMGPYTNYQSTAVMVGGRALALWNNGLLAIPSLGPIRSPSYVQAQGTVQVNPDGTIAGVTITNQGNGYLLGPPVTAVIATPPPGITILAHITITAGGIMDQYIIDDIGYGYFGPAPVPTVDPPPGPGTNIVVGVTVTNGRVSGQTATDPGSGYAPPPAAGPNIVFPPPPAGVQEVVTSVTIVNGHVMGVTLAGVGTGYDPLNPPAITFSLPV